MKPPKLKPVPAETRRWQRLGIAEYQVEIPPMRIKQTEEHTQDATIHVDPNTDILFSFKLPTNP